jgi:hypothetical protein
MTETPAIDHLPVPAWRSEQDLRDLAAEASRLGADGQEWVQVYGSDSETPVLWSYLDETGERWIVINPDPEAPALLRLDEDLQPVLEPIVFHIQSPRAYEHSPSAALPAPEQMQPLIGYLQAINRLDGHRIVRRGR